jgi:ribosomal-protein-alanine N-acetyltransferase
VFDFTYFPHLDTDRLILDEIVEDDLDSVMALFGDPQVTRYNDVETFRDTRDARWLLKFLRARFDEHVGLRWAIRLKTDPERLIGTAGYNVWNRHNACGEIGYDLLPAYWNQGLTTEAVRAVVCFGFEQMQLNRVEADVSLGNDASVRVLQKLGFTEEGTLRQRGFWKGRYHDLRFFSLLREEDENATL